MTRSIFEDQRVGAAAPMTDKPHTPTPDFASFWMLVEVLWKKHGGKSHGPHVETRSIPDGAFFQFIKELREQSAAASQAELVAALRRSVDRIRRLVDAGAPLSIIRAEADVIEARIDAALAQEQGNGG